MSTTITITLPADIGKELKAAVKRSGKTQSDVVRDALRRQLAIERFRALRQQTVPLARKAGIFTDDDVFRLVS